MKYNEYKAGLCIMPHELNCIHDKPWVSRGKNFNIKVVEVYYPDQTKYEVRIEAPNIQRAQFVCDLIVCGINVVEGQCDFEIRDLVAKPLHVSEKQLFVTNLGEIQIQNLFLIFDLVSKASFRNIYINALTKYSLAVQLHSNAWVDLDPSLSGANIPVSPFPYDHLRYGYSIIIAYSVLEELKLEVRASTVKPSVKNGIMNPVVRSDLEKRLIKANIDISESIVWQRRGGKKSIESKLDKRSTPAYKEKASWSYGKVRDHIIPLTDAINEVSWIRSKIASHKVKKDIKVLSVYDVSNSQHLARRLILECLGFWTKMKSE